MHIRLIHWKPAEGEPIAELLRSAGYKVAYDADDGPELLRALRDAPPDAVVIDLVRQPSQGRDMALALRSYVATRRVPLVFVGGDEGKVAAIRGLLPDAVYTGYEDLASAVARAIASPPTDPVVPASRMAGYAGAPLLRKLGIRTGTRVALVDAPSGVEALLGDLPDRAAVTREASAARDLTLWFVRSQEELERVGEMVEHAEGGGLWIAWPKKGSTLSGKVTQNVVRAAGLAAGLVDYKICAIDATWSGLRFTRRSAG